MNAAMALDYPDTRENPDSPVDWDKIDINSKEIQGIVKFKRALKDGGTPISMTYVSPSKFQELVSKYNLEEDNDKRKKALEEVLKHFTIERSSDSSGAGGSPIVAEALKYACSFVGKVTYELGAGGKLEDGKSDCSHFVHRVFGHVGLMEDTLEYFDKYGHSRTWGYGGDAGGCPGTVKIGTDLSKASPGDVIWWHFGEGSNNHVAIYLGNGKIVECAGGKGNVVISNIENGEGYDEILHFSQLPTDPTGYFDPDTMTLHSSLGGGEISKVPSLNGMVFIGDSIMYCLAEKDNTLKNEGAKYLYRGGSTAKYFLGKETADGSTNNCIENNGYFNWNANFKNITNPTGFYLVLGQNFFYADDRINQMDELIKKIRSQYSSPPIYISSVLHYIDGDGSAERAATKMNEELKVYCAGQNNVYYSDILRGYNDNLRAMTEDDNDHPNSQGSSLLVKNIKENIVGESSNSATNSVTGEMIVQEAEKYVGKIPYVWGGESLETGADCSGFAWAILKKLGLIDWERTDDKGFRNKGTEVADISQAQPGDILCFNEHISIYKGNGYMVEALNETKGIVNDRKVTDEKRSVLTIRRFTNSSGTSANQQTSKFKVKVATWNETEDIMDAEDPAVSDYHTHTYNITSTTIPYQEIVSKYKMPFNYLWTMLVYSQDKDYVFDLAKLVDNSKIEITIHDNYTETTNIVTDKYTKYKRLYTTAGADVDYKYFYLQTITEKNSLIPKDIKIDKSDTASVSVDAETIYEPSYTNVHTTINRNNTLDIALTLADSWFVKYTKKYTYNELNKITSPSNTEKLGDIVNDSEKVKNDYGGNKEKLIGKAKDKALEEGRDKHGSAFEPSEPSFYNVSTEYTSKVINRSTTTQNIVESSSYVSSVPGGGGISLGTSISNVKTGSLNKNNYVELPSPKSDGDASNPLQGFCIVEDSMMAYVINHKTSPETCTLCLVDINTTQEYDKMNGLYGHGNTIAYDPVNSEIIFPEDGVIQLIKVNKTTKKFEGKRSISPPQRTRSPSQMAYNATHDLFIANSHVYTRDAFYSGGKPIKDLDYNMLEGDDLYAGSTSYGNHVYYYFADGYGHSTNYLVVCDLNTGGQVELIRDNMAREGEEASFTSDGTLYLFHGEAGSPFHKTDYNYFYDTNIDTSNVTPGVGRAANDIARYNTGGDYTEMASFEKVFNSHYNARSNIISITEWLFEALEQNSDTEKMADLTRYLLHKATGNDYGEYGDKQFDYEAYGQEDFISVSSGIYGNTPQEKVWFALRGAGFSEYAVAGAMGNIEAESHFRQDAIEGGTGIGFGLCQWSYGRRTQLENYAKSKGKSPSDIEIQIEFLIGELTPGGGADGYANYQFGSNGENWKNAASVDIATDLYCRYFERPNMKYAHMDVRKEAANKYYNEFHGKTAPTGIGNGDVISVCKEVTQHFLSRNVRYSTAGSNLISGNIEKCYNESNYICCSTYVSCVLYKSGLMTANQLNKYNYHATWIQKEMFEKEGWRKIPFSQAKPGDVVIHKPGSQGHALIYAGGNLCWDETSATSRTNSTVSKSNSYLSEAYIYRAPGR